MDKSRIKMEGQLAEDFNNLMYKLTKLAARNSFSDFLEECNISEEEYEEIKEYLYDKYKVVTYI